MGRTFKLPPELIGRYEARAKSLGVTYTAFVERALEAACGSERSVVSSVAVESAEVAVRAAAARSSMREVSRGD